MTKLQAFAKKYPEYWWWVPEVENLSHESIVEGVLNYGEFSEKKELIKILGEKEFERIFSTIRNKPRSNLRKEAGVYWDLYIGKHFHNA